MRRESGAAVPEFVLVLILLVPLVLGIIHVALVMHVRNTLTSAASAGARSGVGLDSTPEHGIERARELIDASIAGRYASNVTARRTTLEGIAVIEVRIVAEVPAVGLLGPATSIESRGHAVLQVAP